MEQTTTTNPISSADKCHCEPESALDVAVIGCGYWGPNHIRSFQNVGNCRVTAVDCDYSTLARMAKQFLQIRVESQIENIWSDPNVNAVVIATPTATHFDLVQKALLSGKHVLCEKPLATISRQAEELTRLAAERKLRLMTGHTFLFNPGIVKIKQLIENDELGSIYSLSSIRTNLGPIRSDVNAAYDLAAHDVSVFNWLLDSEPDLVSAFGGAFVQPGIQDIVFINLQYPDGQVANIHASWLNPRKVRQMTIVGKRRMITWDDLAMQTPVAIYDRGANVALADPSFGEFQRIAMWDGDVRLPRIEPTEPLKVQTKYFLDSLRDPSQSRSDGRFSTGVVRTLEAIARSLSQSGLPVRPAEITV